MDNDRRYYPIGLQTFSELRTRKNYVYIDKTEYVYRMTNSDAKYIFLSRPRRFGKSLLVSTLHSYFEGRRELFKGLAIEGLEKDWTVFPVLHFDMSLAKHMEKEQLETMISFQLLDYEKIYGKSEEGAGLNDRLTGLIKRASQQTGQQVVVLIDEYDAPLLDVMHEERNLPVLRQVMRNFYSPLKACDPWLRFVFLTGITKFSQLSIFSELNNIKNISMDTDYAAVCGITEDEMLSQMSEDIDLMADRMRISREELLEKLKDYYDGYHFTWPSPDIYNPYSLMNAFADKKIRSYWFGSGTPTYLLEMLRKYHVAPSEIGGASVQASAFDAPTEKMTEITPLLYQSGYVTIKSYSDRLGLFSLDIPNKEVRIGLMESLLPNYLHGTPPSAATSTVAYLFDAMDRNDMDGAMSLLQKYLSTIPYTDNTDYEGHWQQLLYVIFSLLGYYVDVEVRTPRGRVDMIVRTTSKLYLIELKLDRSAETAMQQIDLRQYPERFALCGLPVVRVAVNFDSATHTISDWIISE